MGTPTLFFSYYLSSCSITGYWIQFPVLIQQLSLYFYLTFIPIPHPSPAVNHVCSCKSLIMYFLVSYLVNCIYSHFVHSAPWFCFSLGFVLFCFWGTSMWKFLGQRPNPCHGSNQSHCSDNIRSLTCCTKRELQHPVFWSLFCFVLLLFMVASEAYGDSQARGQTEL